MQVRIRLLRLHAGVVAERNFSYARPTMANKIAIALLLASAIATPVTSSSNVGISRFPKGIMQVEEGPVQTDDFVVVNAGSDPASVTITITKGTFFTVS